MARTTDLSFIRFGAIHHQSTIQPVQPFWVVSFLLPSVSFSSVLIIDKADPALRRNRLRKEQLVDGFNDRGDLLAVLLLLACQVFDCSCQVFVCGENFTGPDE